MSLPKSLLELPRDEAVRLIALERLAEVRKAAPRLDDPEDVEALHDFRVAVRRLRSIARAWKKPLRGRIDREDRTRLGAVQAATGGGRDAEVALEWLATQREGLSEEEAGGHAWLVQRLEERHAAAMAHVREDVRAAFAGLDDVLASELEAELPTKKKKKEAKPFRRALRRTLREHDQELGNLLGGIDGPEEESNLHEARIAAKRLRYLVEPVRPLATAAVGLVRALKPLQDLLGEINDAHVQSREMRTCLEELVGSEEQGRVRPGIDALLQRAQTRLDSLHAALKSEWLDADLLPLHHPLRELIEQLGQPG